VAIAAVVLEPHEVDSVKVLDVLTDEDLSCDKVALLVDEAIQEMAPEDHMVRQRCEDVVKCQMHMFLVNALSVNAILEMSEAAIVTIVRDDVQYQLLART